MLNDALNTFLSMDILLSDTRYWNTNTGFSGEKQLLAWLNLVGTLHNWATLWTVHQPSQSDVSYSLLELPDSFVHLGRVDHCGTAEDGRVKQVGNVPRPHSLQVTQRHTGHFLQQIPGK